MTGSVDALLATGKITDTTARRLTVAGKIIGYGGVAGLILLSLPLFPLLLGYLLNLFSGN